MVCWGRGGRGADMTKAAVAAVAYKNSASLLKRLLWVLGALLCGVEIEDAAIVAVLSVHRGCHMFGQFVLRGATDGDCRLVGALLRVMEVKDLTVVAPGTQRGRRSDFLLCSW